MNPEFPSYWLLLHLLQWALNFANVTSIVTQPFRTPYDMRCVTTHRRMRRRQTKPYQSMKWTNRTGLTSFFGNFLLAFQTSQPKRQRIKFIDWQNHRQNHKTNIAWQRYDTLHCRVWTKTTTSTAFLVWKFYLQKYNNLSLYIHDLIART